MKEKEKILFEQLKKQVAATFLRENPAQSPDISKWKGDDIVRFQEDLLHKVKARVSEKWFYNYFRKDIQKLPRIDMLNLLSEYAGYKNWADFMQQNYRLKKSLNRKKILGIVLLIAVLAGMGYGLSNKNPKSIQFCFVDETGHQAKQIKVIQLMKNQTEKILPLKNACVKPETAQRKIQLKIISPYYKDKLIIREIDDDKYSEQVVLQPDLYALLLKRYSTTDTENWQKRKRNLEQLIADDALIYQQWFGKGKGIEVYDKSDFIAQLCIPTGMFRNIEILEISYQKSQIKKLRFTILKTK